MRQASGVAWAESASRSLSNGGDVVANKLAATARLDSEDHRNLIPPEEVYPKW